MANIRIDANAQKAIAEFEKLVRAESKVGDGLDDIADKSRKSAADERRLGNLRNKLMRETDTAQERFKRRLADVQKSLKGTEVSEERLGRIRDKLHADYVADLERERESLGDVEEASGGAFSIAGVSAFDAAVGLSTVTVTALGKLLAGVREEANAAGEKLKEIVGSSGNLVQLAGGDQRLRDQLFAASDQVFTSGTVSSREQADRLVFELQSAGRLGDIDFFTQLAAIDDAALLAKSANLIATGFGEAEAGGSSDIISKAIAAALPATGVSPSDIAEGVAKAAPSATAFGLSDEELFAAVSRVAELTGSGSEAGSRVSRLLGSATRQGLADQLRGQGIGAIIEAIGSANTTEAELIKFLGSREASQAFGVLRDVQALGGRFQEIRAAQAGGLAGATIDNALGSDRVRATIAARAASAERQTLLDQTSTRELLADAESQGFSNLVRRSYGDLAGFAAETAFGAARLVPGVDAEMARNQRNTLAVEDIVRAAGRSDQTAEVVRAVREQTKVIEKQQQGIPVR